MLDTPSIGPLSLTIRLAPLWYESVEGGSLPAAAERPELLRLNVCLIALVAEWLEQVLHELVHVVAALLMDKLIFPQKNGHLKRRLWITFARIGLESGSPELSDSFLCCRRSLCIQIGHDARPGNRAIGNDRSTRS